MCYHTEQKATAKELKDHFKATFSKEVDYQPELFINGFTKPFCPIITAENPKEIQLFQWGLVPHFELNIKRGNTLNAIYETLDQRVTYKNYTQQRCIVPVTGLYEWFTVGKYKEKKKYTIADQSIFCFAGLWNRCIHPETKQEIHSYTLVTKEGFAAILLDEQAWLNQGELIINKNEIITHLTPPQLDMFGDGLE
jgi:putative SOS response-associated peptidase YedK